MALLAALHTIFAKVVCYLYLIRNKAISFFNMPIKISFVALFKDAPYPFKESRLWMFILTFLNYGFIHIILADHIIDGTLFLKKHNYSIFRYFTCISYSNTIDVFFIQVSAL